MPIRWRFTDAAEDAERARVLQRVDAWWIAFAASVSQIEEGIRTLSLDATREMINRLLPAIDARLFDWELGHSERGYQLVISPGPHAELAPLIEQIMRRAPRLKGWELLRWRPAARSQEARELVAGRCGVDLDGMRFRLVREPFRLFSLEVAWPGWSADDALRNAITAVAVVLGEEQLQHWIGLVTPVRKGLFDRKGWLDAAQLRAQIEREIEASQQQLPETPLFRHDGDLEAVYDLGNESVYRALKARPNFHSGRFSRFGETFCYLELANPVPVELLHALGGALIDAGVGTPISLVGRREDTLIDLALIQVDRAMNVMMPVLEAFGARGRLLFFDAELAGEWIAVSSADPIDAPGELASITST